MTGNCVLRSPTQTEQNQTRRYSSSDILDTKGGGVLSTYFLFPITVTSYMMSPMASQITNVSIGLDCLLNHLFRRRSKKTAKLRVTGLYEGNWPVTHLWIPAHRASNAENVSIWWRHHAQNLTDDQSTLVLLTWGIEPIDKLVEYLWRHLRGLTKISTVTWT